MKTFIFSLALLLSLSSYSQNCLSYYLMQNNKTIENTIYDKKGNASAKQVYTVSNVTTSGGTSSADINLEMFDKKGGSIAKSKSNIKCTGGVMLMNMQMMMPQQQQEQAAKAEASVESAFIEYPASMSVGDNLKDGNFSMTMNNSGMQQNLTMSITDRKVEAKEKITTPAGSWDCYKISYNGKISIKMMGIGIPVNISGAEWFAPSFGIVKTKSNYGGTEITSIH